VTDPGEVLLGVGGLPEGLLLLDRQPQMLQRLVGPAQQALVAGEVVVQESDVRVALEGGLVGGDREVGLAQPFRAPAESHGRRDVAGL